MKTIRQISKPTAIFLALNLLMLSGLYQSAWAVMIDTESIINIDGGQSARGYLNNLLGRENIQAALVSQGIDPQEVKARIESLSDAEVNDIVDKLDHLPAGGGVLETLIIVVFLVFLILLITDIAGYTDIFPFVKAKK